MEILQFIAQLVGVIAFPLVAIIIALLYKHEFKKIQAQQEQERNDYYNDIYWH